MREQEELIQPVLFLIFFISASATIVSLFFSITMKLPPCDLCWYQRICMYPIALISLVGLARKEIAPLFYIAPLALIGAGIAAYHNLIYYGLIEHIVPCSPGASCTTKQIEWFGLITIPLMSIVAFAFILAAQIFFYFGKKGAVSEE